MPYSCQAFTLASLPFTAGTHPFCLWGILCGGELLSAFLPQHFTRRTSNFSGQFFFIIIIAGSPPFSPQYLMQGREYHLLRFTHLVFRFSYFEPLGFLCSQLPVYMYTPSSIIITKYLNSSHKQADTKEFSLIYTTAPLSPIFPTWF